RPFIYTTAPSQHSVASIGCAFDFLTSNIQLQQSLNHKIRHFLHGAEGLPNRTNSFSAIQTFIIPGNKAIRLAAQHLQQKGFDVRPILSPTVPKGTERLRICLHTHNSDGEISSLTQTLRSMV
ncbi:MAG: 8-amino-7-oxononanoate synthase, partial [Cyclobacteriaceae bacterium]